jgi:Bacterial DNA-binding protein
VPRPARNVDRNPATGEQIKIPARSRSRFTPAKALKELVLGATATAAKAKSAAKAKPATAKATRKK